MLAPIVLFTYNRPAHTQKTLTSLLQNPLAKDSTLFVFADGAKNETDLLKVKEVHTLLKQIKGFKEIQITIQEKNKGLAHSIIEGVGKVLEAYPTAIVMEDDMLCAPNFLDFMRDALACYAHHERVYSITGYTFPIPIPQNYKEDVYLSPRPSSWGWATWRDRWQKADWEVSDFQTFIKDKNQRQQFNEGGDDMSIMLLRQQKGEINSWAIRWAYTHYKQGAYCLYPTQSKIQNIGADKSGIHTPATSKYEVALYHTPYTLPALPTPNTEIMHNFRQFFKRSPFRKTINWLKYGISS